VVFKGRTVLAFVVMALLAGSVVTWTVAGSLDTQVVSKIVADKPASKEDQPSAAMNGISEDEVAKLSAVYKLLNQRYFEQVDRAKLTDGALDGLVSALEDPYSEYMNAKEIETFFSEHINSSFTGIGAEVTLRDGNIVIVSPIRNSPAERAGLLAGDTIISVNGELLQGFTLSEAVGKIRGPKGTQAKLRILRAGTAEPMEIIVVRDDISLETVEGQMLDGGIGLIRISQFAVNTGERYLEELKKLENKGMQGLIIDVRNNPGGVVEAVQTVADSIVPSGKTIMHLEYRDGKREQTTSKGTGKTYPVVVLINQGSASASEILAAAIEESAGGQLVGKTTFGKGLVQTTVRLNDGSGVKLTIAKWLTPDGEMIHKQGIKPNLDIEQTKLFEAVSIPKEADIHLDMAGEEVKNVQLILEGLGMKPGRTDGYFSQATKNAVVQFQQMYGLTVNGIVDKKTAVKLEEVVIKKYLDPANDTQLKAAITHIQKMKKQ
jgi:carboxyl-terminal processing protease